MDPSQKELTLDVVLIGMGIVFILSVALILFFNVYRRRLLAQHLERQQLELSYQKELLVASIAGQEDERLRIAKELHDDIGAMLTTTKVYFGQFSSNLASVESKGISSKMNQLLDDMIDSTRSISHDLRPIVLEKLGLTTAIESLADTLNESGEIKFEFENHANFKLNKEYELNIYRIIQELVANTLKHSGATIIQLTLNEGQEFKMIYADNGVGIDLSKLTHKKGIGLKNIESRLSVMSGTIDYINENPGFYVEIEI